MTDAPERIYASLNTSTVYMDGSSPLTCRDREFRNSIQYVRADIYDALKAECDTLREKLTAAERERERLERDRDFWKEQFQVETRYRIELADRGTLQALTDANKRMEAAERERDALMADKDRLDFLDQCNANLNAHYGTKYKWEMVLNHNVNRLMTSHLDVDLNDAKAHGFHSCREAIDREMIRVTASRKARATLTSKEPE